jgi:hypothetical protein
MPDLTPLDDAVREAAWAYGARAHLWGEDSCSALEALSDLTAAVAAVERRTVTRCRAAICKIIAKRPPAIYPEQRAYDEGLDDALAAIDEVTP